MTATTPPTTALAPSPRPEPRLAARTVTAFALMTIAAGLVGVVISGASYEPDSVGLPDPGPIVGWGLPIMSGVVFVSAMCTVGWLLLAAFLDPDARNGLVSHRGRQALVRAAIASAVWSIAALTSAAFTLTNILGIPLSSALKPEVVALYAWAIPGVRMLLIAVAFSAVIAVGCVLTAKLSTATAWLVLAVIAVAAPALASHTAGLGDHSLALVNGVAHVIAATLWVGGLLAIAVTAWPFRPESDKAPLAVAVRRFSPLAGVCVGVLLLSGIGNAYTRMATFADLLYTGYGQLVLSKSLLLIVLICSGLAMRKRVVTAFQRTESLTRSRARWLFVRLALLELTLMAVATGLGVALSVTAPTRPDLIAPSTAESLLGFTFPPAPDLQSVLLGWHLDALFLVLGVLGAVLYLAGVARIQRRGDKWPISRTICWLVGMIIIVWATNAGISEFAQMSVSLHMIQHMTLTMLAPIPIVLAAPVTLALRAIQPSTTGGRGPRELLMSALHSQVARILTSPLVVLAIYALGIYGLYFTPAFGVLMSSPIGHIIMTMHFIASGLLLAYVAIGIDPKPRPLAYGARLLLVMAAVVLHTFFALALMGSATAIGSEWFARVQPPWLTDPVRDTVIGGQIAWGFGELPTLLMLLIIAVQWFRSDTRDNKRRDRHTETRGDVELDDYNAYLAKLNARDQKQNKASHEL